MLRLATREQHQALDASVGMTSFDSREQYIQFLRASYQAVAPLESTLEPWLGADYAPVRAERIVGDLTQLNAVSALNAEPAAWRPESAAQAWGCAYVLEGSALGGAVLALRARQRLGADLPCRYLSPSTSDTPLRWKWFLAALESFAYAASESAREQCVYGAVKTFEVFGAAFKSR